jgi:hypothetical protein
MNLAGFDLAFDHGATHAAGDGSSIRVPSAAAQSTSHGISWLC